MLVSFKRSKDRISVWVTNDNPESLNGTLILARLSVEGTTQWSSEHQVKIPRDSSLQVIQIEEAQFDSLRRDSEYLHARLVIDGVLVTENRFYFEEPKHMTLPGKGPTGEIRDEGNGRFVLRLIAEKLARDVFVEIEGEDAVFEDNYIDVDAGTAKEIRFSSRSGYQDLLKRLKIEWLR